MKYSSLVNLALVSFSLLLMTLGACGPANLASTSDQLAQGPDLSKEKGYGNATALEIGTKNCSKSFLEDQSKLKENLSSFRSETNKTKKKELTETAKNYLLHLRHKYTEIVCRWTDEHRNDQAHDTDRDYAEALKDVEQNLKALN